MEYQQSFTRSIETLSKVNIMEFVQEFFREGMANKEMNKIVIIYIAANEKQSN